EMRPLSVRYREAVEAAKTDGGRAVEFDSAELAKLLELSRAVMAIDEHELTPKAVEFALVAIEGLTIVEADGVGRVATLELVRENGPEELYAEMAAAVRRELGLDEEERENLSSRSTSDAPEDGSAKHGSADGAGKLVTITSGAAPSSTVQGSAIASSIA